MSVELTKKFIEGLKQYNLTQEDIINNNFYYCGGDTKQHLNYYKLKYKDEELHKFNGKCICGHKIVENCYITDGNITLTLGNCCIKKFIPKDKAGRTCNKCGKSHRNRIVDMCNDCKTDYCHKCGIEKNEKYKQYKLCYICYMNSKPQL